VGDHRRPVTTRSAAAQRYFDQGLSLVYAFNHDEARESFREAERLDAACAMASWGVAYANGPHINYPLVPENRGREAHDALTRAKAHLEGARPVERALVEALATRYAWPAPKDRSALDEAYATAMRKVAAAFPDDADVAALTAEALMDLHPWDLWTPAGAPQPWTPEIVQRLEAVLARAPNHPLANHLYIHAVEASPAPGRADAAAQRLRTLQPGLAHMLHMPSHIDVRRGRWEEAITANTRALEADRRYQERRPRQGFYRMYMAHNHHMLAFAAMMTGQSEVALRAIREMVAPLTADVVRERPFLDGLLAMPFEVLLRFGKWEEVLSEPEPPLPLSRTLWRYARGVARAARGELREARAEQAAFAVARKAIAADDAFGNNSAEAIVAVAEHVLAGEILLKEGAVAAAVEELRRGVAAEDALRYDEPPDWIQPVRHALGATLLHAGRAAEAEAVYREDLARAPGNVWALVGLARSLRRQDRARDAAAVEAELARAGAKADVALSSSCLCLPGV
jgi:tetratricopeptide (TPR) repeat protein